MDMPVNQKDTLEQRYGLLKTHLEIFGPRDSKKRPVIIMFHGCGGKRPFLTTYAKAAAALGMRAVIVDSTRPRGMGSTESRATVCTGVRLRGDERAGDVLAVLSGLKERQDMDLDNVILAGWSHGGWTISDLMTMKLDKSGDAGVADPDPKLVDGVKGAFLVYPYLGIIARSSHQDWVHHPRTVAVLGKYDHLYIFDDPEKALDRIRKSGTTVTSVTVDATHAFDEVPRAYQVGTEPVVVPNEMPPEKMLPGQTTYNAKAFGQALEAMRGLVAELFGNKLQVLNAGEDLTRPLTCRFENMHGTYVY